MSHITDSRLVLAVRDLRASTSFYLDVLGMQRDFGDSSDGWAFLSRGKFRVMLGECPDEQPAAAIGDHSYVAYLLVDDVDALYADFVRRGAADLSPPADQPWGIREFGLRTPDGHRFTFGQPVEAAIAAPAGT